MGTVCIAMLAQGIYRQMAQHEPITAVLKALHMPEIGCGPISGLHISDLVHCGLCSCLPLAALPMVSMHDFLGLEALGALTHILRKGQTPSTGWHGAGLEACCLAMSCCQLCTGLVCIVDAGCCSMAVSLPSIPCWQMVSTGRRAQPCCRC